MPVHRLPFHVAIGNDRGAALSPLRIHRQEKEKEEIVTVMVECWKVEEAEEDDSETRAHYPIVGSALADGVYGDSKS